MAAPLRLSASFGSWVGRWRGPPVRDVGFPGAADHVDKIPLRGPAEVPGDPVDRTDDVGGVSGTAVDDLVLHRRTGHRGDRVGHLEHAAAGAAAHVVRRRPETRLERLGRTNVPVRDGAP